MRCERCKASCEDHYAESYDVDWYCMIGVPESAMYEDKNGEWGCNMHYKTINKKVKEIEKHIEREREAYVEWFLKEKENENERHDR